MNSVVWDDCGHSFLFKNNYRKMCVFCSFFLKYGKMHFCITSQLTSWKSYKVIIYRLHLCSRGTDRRKFKSQNVFFRFSFELDSEDCKKNPNKNKNKKNPHQLPDTFGQHYCGMYTVVMTNNDVEGWHYTIKKTPNKFRKLASFFSR